MLSGLMNIGQSALNASQAWISVTGNNLANVDTEGYSRQYVDQTDRGGLTVNGGAKPLGVDVQQIMRFFDQFLEKSYVRQSTTSARWDQQDTIMASLENIFNEANRQGVSSSLTNFFNAWQDLALRPDDISVRQNLLSYADNLSSMIQNTSSAVKQLQEEMDVSIKAGVERVNEIAEAIADLNSQISRHTITGVSNPNSLLDKRDQLVRELASWVDVETIDHGAGDFRVQLSSGQPLVDGVETYRLITQAPVTENQLLPTSKYDGTVLVNGSDTFEYTVEIVDGSDTGAPSFRVSVDGGKSWLKNEDGTTSIFKITNEQGFTDDKGKPVTDQVLVKDLSIQFSSTENFTAGDRFIITPKSGLYWEEPTRGPINVTPQIYLDGTENQSRVTGGKLAAYFNIRDDNCGRYLDELDAMTSSLIWEVNRIHTQGAGLSKLDYAQGQQVVGNIYEGLGTANSMLPWYDKLQEGNVNFHFYNAETGEHMDSALLFADGNFNPKEDSLSDVVAALNSIKMKDGKISTDDDAEQVFNATIQDGKLLIEKFNPDSNIQFAMGADSSGLMAALGINSFFTGSDATNIAVNSMLHTNTNLIAAGEVNGDFEVNAGDNIIATAIGKLADKEVTITTMWKTVKNQSLSQYYANLVTTVGTDRRTSQTNAEYNEALTSDLYERVSSVTGVNMDEEMTNLIKFQHSYTAAAKLITTADEMLQTLLGLKQ